MNGDKHPCVYELCMPWASMCVSVCNDIILYYIYFFWADTKRDYNLPRFFPYNISRWNEKKWNKQTNESNEIVWMNECMNEIKF